MSKSQKIINGVSNVLGGVTNAIYSGMQLAQNKDTSGLESQMYDIQESPVYINDYDSLMADYNSYSPFKTNYTKDDVAGVSDMGKIWGTAISGITGAVNGSNNGLFGTIDGAVTGLLGASIGAGIGSLRAKEKAEQLNSLASETNNMYLRQFDNNAGNIKNKTFRNATLNLSALGGPLDSFTKSRLLSKSFKMKPRKMKYGGFGNYFAYGGNLSGDWTNGVTIINEGGTHEQNPYEGVLVGKDEQGTPNLVEEGEVIFNDYVYSNRLKPTAKQLEDVKLDPKFEGMTFADIAKEVQKESSIRPLDPISKNTLVDSMSKLTAIQEETRAKKAQRQFMKEFKAMTPEEQQDTLMQMMPQEESQPEEMMSEQDAINIMNGRTPRAYQDIREEMPQMEDEEFAFGGNIFGRRYNRFDNGSWMYGVNPLNFNNGNLNFDELYAKDSDFMKKRQYIIDNWGTQPVNDWLNQTYIPWVTKYNESRGYSGNFTVNKDQFIKGTQDRKYGAMHTGVFGFNIPQPAPTETPTTEPTVAETPAAKIINVLTDGEDEIPISDNELGKYIKGKSYVDEEGNTIQQYTLNKPENKIEAETYEYPKSNFLQYAPILGSIMGLFGNKPDYSNADLIARGRRGIRDVRARAIGNYLQYNPFDTNFEQNRLAGITAGTQRAIINNAANRGQAIGSLLPLYGQELTQLGQLYRSAREYNDNQRKTVADFNRGTDLYNAQFEMQADQINSNLDTQRANLYTQEAQMRDNIESAASQAKSNNITNLFDNLGNLGRSIYSDQQLRWLLERGYIPNVKAASGGKVRRKKKGLLR